MTKTNIQTGDEFVTIIVRDDLTQGYKVVQSAHALADFAVKFESEFKKWQQGSNYLCCLEATTDKIERIISKLDSLDIKYQEFIEPDIGNQITSVAIEAISRQQHRKLFRNLKLTLS